MDFLKKRILIVEDEMIIAEDIRDSLESHGYNVIDMISSGEETLEKISELRPDLILMDIMLSDELNGIQTADKINKQYNIPIIFVTALRNKNELKSHFQGKFSYVSKPYKEIELFTAIEINFYKQGMEKTLANQKEKLVNLINSIPLGVVHLSDDGKITKCNDLALVILDSQLEDIENEYFSYPFEPGEISEITLQDKHDSIKIIQCTALKSESDDYNGFIVFLQDVTELHFYKNENRNITIKLNNVLKNLEIPYARINSNNKLTFEDANSAFIRFIGLQSFRKLFDIKVESIFDNILDLKNIFKKIEQGHLIEKTTINVKNLAGEIIPVKFYAEYSKLNKQTVIELFFN